MHIRQRKGNEERMILIGMIVDRAVLARISLKWKRPMFASAIGDRIGQWCVNYFAKYNKAPKADIQTVYDRWAQRTQNKKQADLVEQFLDGLSDEYEHLSQESNTDYVLDCAGIHFNKVRLERLADAIQGDLETGNGDEAIHRVSTYHRVEMGADAGIDVLGDKEAIRKAFEYNYDTLIRYKDGLGEFFGNQLQRDGFIAFMGPDKRGKSYWLMDIAFKAVLQGRRVAFFECGDLSQNQIMQRFMVRVAGRPAWPCTVRRATRIALSKHKSQAVVAYETRRFKDRLDWRTAYKACRRFLRARPVASMLRLSCHPTDSLSTHTIRNILDEWEADGWIPDVIVVDYADILDMDVYGLEGRDRINQTWKNLRKISLEQHCLVVTATQSDADSYNVGTMNRKHFSDDKRKNAHVTGMVGLNQTQDEKNMGYMRLNWIVLREGFFIERQCCYVAACFELANMSVKSIMDRRH